MLCCRCDTFFLFLLYVLRTFYGCTKFVLAILEMFWHHVTSVTTPQSISCGQPWRSSHRGKFLNSCIFLLPTPSFSNFMRLTCPACLVAFPIYLSLWTNMVLSGLDWLTQNQTRNVPASMEWTSSSRRTRTASTTTCSSVCCKRWHWTTGSTTPTALWSAFHFTNPHASVHSLHLYLSCQEPTICNERFAGIAG